jgi:hypothetical protein
MDTEATRKLVLRFVEARAANDESALFELLAEDAEWRPPAGAALGPFRGRRLQPDHRHTGPHRFASASSGHHKPALTLLMPTEVASDTSHRTLTRD